MELTPSTGEVYLRHAFGQMSAVAERVGEPEINERPLGPTTNAIAALIVHCCGVAEYWLGHVALGRPSTRQREDEFSRTATLDELRGMIDRACEQTVADLATLEEGSGSDEGGRQLLPGGDTSDASVLLHVLEALYQHLGHMELAADALAGPRPS